MSSWLISSIILSMVISSEITSRFCLKITAKQINTLKELLDSKMSLILFPTFVDLNSIQDRNIFKRIMAKAEQERTILDISQMFQEQNWIMSTADGKAAMFMGEVTLKTVAAKYSSLFRHNTKLRFLQEHFRYSFLISIASSTRLSKKFRTMLDYR